MHLGNWARQAGGLHHHGNPADFRPDLECVGPGGSVLGGGDVIAVEIRQIVDLIVGRKDSAAPGRAI
jgi:hypothetical protein